MQNTYESLGQSDGFQQLNGDGSDDFTFSLTKIEANKTSDNDVGLEQNLLPEVFSSEKHDKMLKTNDSWDLTPNTH